MKLLAIRNFSGFLPLSFLILLSQRLQKVHKVQKLQCHEIKVVQFNVHNPSQEIVLVEFSWSLSASSTPPSWLPVQIMPQYHKSLTLVVVLHSITQYHTSTSITLVSPQYQYYTSITLVLVLHQYHPSTSITLVSQNQIPPPAGISTRLVAFHAIPHLLQSQNHNFYFSAGFAMSIFCQYFHQYFQYIVYTIQTTLHCVNQMVMICQDLFSFLMMIMTMQCKVYQAYLHCTMVALVPHQKRLYFP